MAFKRKSEPESKPAAKTPASTVPDYHQIVGLGKTKIATVASRLAEIQQQMKELDEEAKDLKAIGARLLDSAKVKSVMVGDLRVTVLSGQVKKLSRKLLLKNGVDEEILEKSYELGQPWVSLKVTAKKEGEEGQEDE